MKGFTLIELLVAVAITMIAGALLLNIFVDSNKIFYSQRDKVSQGLSLADAMKDIEDLVRLSNSVVASHTVGPNTYTSSLNTLVIAVPSINSSGDNIQNVSDYIVVERDPTNPRLLRLRTFPDAQSIRSSKSQIIATNLSRINFFYYDDNNAVVLPANATKVNVTINVIEQTINSKASSASSDINLRNN